MGIKANITEKFNRLEPDKRRKVLIISVLCTVLGVLSAAVLITDDSSPKEAKTDLKKESISNVLMGTGSREIGLAGVSNDMQALKAENAKLLERMNQLETVKSNPAPDAPQDPDAALADLSAGLRQERSVIAPPGTMFNSERPTALPAPGLPMTNTPAQPAPANMVQPPPPVMGPPIINTTRSEAPKMSAAKARLRHVYLPTGSIMSGVLLNGLDAPTGRTAQSAPIPVVVRVKHDAILPSQYRSDVKEAFILAAGFGDLSSERAYLRAERLSMILRNGEVIDLPIKMSAVGGDGKSGLRGRVISKQGSVIGQALLAGMADGVSRAFGNSNSFGRGNSDVPSGDEVMVSGIGGGATGALDRIASYFLSQAEAMYPVVEIDAGREISFVLLDGLELVPRIPSDEESSPVEGNKQDAAVAKK